MKVKELFNEKKTVKAVITRSLLGDGYNYYVDLIRITEEGKMFIIDAVQKGSLMSMNEAESFAKFALSRNQF